MTSVPADAGSGNVYRLSGYAKVDSPLALAVGIRFGMAGNAVSLGIRDRIAILIHRGNGPALLSAERIASRLAAAASG